MKKEKICILGRKKRDRKLKGYEKNRTTKLLLTRFTKKSVVIMFLFSSLSILQVLIMIGWKIDVIYIERANIPYNIHITNVPVRPILSDSMIHMYYVGCEHAGRYAVQRGGGRVHEGGGRGKIAL